MASSRQPGGVNGVRMAMPRWSGEPSGSPGESPAPRLWAFFRSRSPLTYEWTGVLAAVVLVSLVIGLDWGGDNVVRALSDVGQSVTAGFAAIASWDAGRRRRGRPRVAWYAICLAATSWCIGEAAWTWYELVLDRPGPVFGIPDAGFLGFPLPLLAGIVLLANARAYRSISTSIEALVVVLVLAMGFWELLIHPAWQASDSTLVERIVNVSYPAADLVLLAALVFSVSGRRHARARFVVLTFVWGLALFLASDIAYAAITLHADYYGGHVADLGWLGGFTMMGLAARTERYWHCDYETNRADVDRPIWPQLAPLFLVPAISAFILWADIGHDVTSDPVLLVLAFGASALVVSRQVLVVLDNVSMTREALRSHLHLEARVAERTREVVRTEATFRFLTESAHDGIVTIDSSGRVLSCNYAARHILGFGPDEPIRHVGQLLDSIAGRGASPMEELALLARNAGDGEIAAPIEITAVRRDGSEFPMELSLSSWTADGSLNFGAVLRDISERKRSEERLVYLAEYDGLTGLRNRRRLEEEVAAELARGRAYATTTSLLFIDLDRFKSINDSLGHQSGDEILVNLSRLIVDCLDETAFVARLGGDEFAVLLPFTDGPTALTIARYLADRIRDHAMVSHGQVLTTTASIGVACAPEHGKDVAELLVHADRAMYEAKHYRDHAVLFNPRREGDELTMRLPWPQRIRAALDEGRLSLYLQPILARSGEITQFEALIRLEEADEIILPGAFMEDVEDSAVIHAIDRWVTQEAIEMVARANASSRRLSLEVNLSARAFSDGELLPLIEAEIQRNGIDASALCFEITETAAIADTDKARVFIARLKALGCRFALDDFGVGFSSFASLKALDVDYVKIDGSFVRNATRDEVDQEIVRCIVQMTRAMGKQTVAEYVADDDTLRLMQALGVDYAQGFAIGRPMPEAIALQTASESAA